MAITQTEIALPCYNGSSDDGNVDLRIQECSAMYATTDLNECE